VGPSFVDLVVSKGNLRPSLLIYSGSWTRPLDGWDHASIWGWDEAVDSLFADLRRNSDDPDKLPVIRIRPDDYTPVITLLSTLAQHIAMAAGRDPWEVVTALHEADDQDEEDWDDDEIGAERDEAGTVVTMTEGYGIWWPPNFGADRKRPA